MGKSTPWTVGSVNLRKFGWLNSRDKAPQELPVLDDKE